LHEWLIFYVRLFGWPDHQAVLSEGAAISYSDVSQSQRMGKKKPLRGSRSGFFSWLSD